MRAEDYVQFAMGLGALQKPRELYELVKDVMALKPKVVLEIGVCHGGTFRVWQDIVGPDGICVGVDLPGGEYGGGPSETERSFITNRDAPYTRLILGDSHSPDVQREVSFALQGRSVDLLVIDGDHTYEGALEDVTRYQHLLGPGGIMALHDICTHPPEAKCDVNKVWDELKDSHAVTKEIVTEPTNWGGWGLVLWVTGFNGDIP